MGRLSTTCRGAKNVRGRVNDPDYDTEYQLFPRPCLVFHFANGSAKRTSKAGKWIGRDVGFGDEVIHFDLCHPLEVSEQEVTVELRYFRNDDNNSKRPQHNIENLDETVNRFVAVTRN